ncbi:MAG: Asp23/Gls24 family envelope stress response protein [Coriobacteriia bacterium]|nr:Asp23/Gls24 family envelope stress response protein [Coriobacteriia bacterium]
MNETEGQAVVIAPGVAESIVALAVAQVEGVAQIGSKVSQVSGGLFGVMSKNPVISGVLILEEEGSIVVELRIKVFYGYKLQEVAASVRATAADALLAQACIEIDRVNITIDGIIFGA